MKKLRTRKHAVVLNRSVGGDAFIGVMLTILGILMFLPVWYLIITAFKPLGERSITPPNFYVIKPTLQNFIDLFTNMNSTWVPMSRYICAVQDPFSRSQIHFRGHSVLPDDFFDRHGNYKLLHLCMARLAEHLHDFDRSGLGIYFGSVPDEAVYRLQRVR